MLRWCGNRENSRECGSPNAERLTNDAHERYCILLLLFCFDANMREYSAPPDLWGMSALGGTCPRDVPERRWAYPWRAVARRAVMSFFNMVRESGLSIGTCNALLVCE